MGNCLVTKLKETVNNDNLSIFDTIRIKLDNIGSGNLYITCLSGGGPLGVKVVDNNGNVMRDDNIQPGATSGITPPSDASTIYTIYLKSKYSVAGIIKAGGVTLNINELSYCANCNIGTTYSYINGDFSSIFKNIGMTQLYIRGMLQGSTCKGNLEDLLVALLNNGKTTDLDVMCTECGGNIKFLGIIPQNELSEHFMCTFENGNTINVYLDTEKTNLYATYANNTWTMANS